MSRAKLFIENFLVYGLVQGINKVVPFLLLPVITRLLEDPSDYGIYDMFTQIIGFGSPLILLGMYDAMFREYFEREDLEYKYNVTYTAQRIVLATSIIGCFLLILLSSMFSKIFFGNFEYRSIVVFSAISLLFATNNSIISAPTRMENKTRIYIISGFINSVGGCIISIILLWFGYSYYSLVYSNIVTAVLVFAFFLALNNKFFTKGKFSKGIAKELFKIGLPLLPTFLIYWIYNSMDRIMIANMLNIGELGIYSIGSKVAAVSHFIYMAFAGGWQYFSFSTMKDEDQIELNSKVFEYLAAISFASVFIAYPFIKIIFNIMFTGVYLRGYIVVPYLYLSPLLLMLFQIASNQFVVIKKSYWATICLSFGAVANVLLNIVLIPLRGIEGAAIATLIGYSLTVLIVVIKTVRMKLLILKSRFIIISVFTIFYLIIIRVYLFSSPIPQIALSIASISTIIFLYRVEINGIFANLKNSHT